MVTHPMFGFSHLWRPRDVIVKIFVSLTSCSPDYLPLGLQRWDSVGPFCLNPPTSYNQGTFTLQMIKLRT